jgi:signal transduction histidine kinase
VVEVQGEKDRRASLENLINDGTSTLNDRLKLAKRDVARLAEAAPKALQTSISSLDKHIHFITTQVSKFESAIEKLGEKREDIIELAGVGNVMHGVMHELTRSTTQTRELMQSLAKGADSQTKDLLEKLEGEIRAINTRLRQLDPLLPGARQSKAEIDVGKLTQTVLSGYKSRFDRHGILPELKFVGGSRELKVKMVPGFLSLALENLISNSVYWIGQRSDKTVDGAIRVEIDAKSKVVTVTDNGPGVAVADRERVFLPGFSLRHRGKGYGLYLAREVAEYHGGKLYLDPDIDANDGNLHTFVLELPR